MSLYFLLTATTFAADPDKKHHHQGVAQRFSNPTKTELSSEEKDLLKKGEAVRKQVREGNGGRGIAIMDVSASSEDIWSVITDFKKYPEWIDQMDSSSIYATNPKSDHTEILVDFTLSAMMISVQYYIDHSYYPDKGYLTWTLDYSKLSDLDDSTGYWLVYPSPDDPNKSRVEYSVDLRVSGWIPGFVEDMLANQGLVDATKWMKRESEKRAAQ
ncbi:MAG: hypothetical protein CMK59_06225 [Proteobacteria bacterium]|nr:hypothetical protein [Pseudomonadota bacterium]